MLGSIISVVHSIVPWPLVRNQSWFNDRRAAGASYVISTDFFTPHCLGHLLPCQLYCLLSPEHHV